MSVPKKVSEAFNRFNAEAKAKQVKPISEAKLPLFALIYALTKVPKSEVALADKSDKSMAKTRFQTSYEAEADGATWLVSVHVPTYAEARSQSPRWENTLRESVKSYKHLFPTQDFTIRPHERGVRLHRSHEVAPKHEAPTEMVGAFCDPETIVIKDDKSFCHKG